MRTHRRPWRAMRRPIVVLTVAAFASACAGHSTPQARADSTPTKPTSTTATTTPDPKAAVLVAYQRFWQVWLAANNPPNPNDPRLAEVDTGAQLAGARASIRNHQLRGEIIRLPHPSRYRHRATVSLLGSRQGAAVIDCALDDAVVLVPATGRVVDARVETQLISADMVLLAGRWKVSALRFVKTWPGATTCAS
jgi:hypothetical protein